jgi:hypothetical protein
MTRRKSSTHYNLLYGELKLNEWLRFDRRSFAEILQTWIERSASADHPDFIRDEPRLDHVLSPADLNRLLTGEALPSRELVLWLAAARNGVNCRASPHSSLPRRPIGAFGNADTTATPVKGQAQACFAPLDGRGASGVGRIPEGPDGRP